MRAVSFVGWDVARPHNIGRDGDRGYTAVCVNFSANSILIVCSYITSHTATCDVIVRTENFELSDCVPVPVKPTRLCVCCILAAAFSSFLFWFEVGWVMGLGVGGG